MNSLLSRLVGLSEEDLAGIDGWSLRLTGVPEDLWIALGGLVVFGLLWWLTARNYRGEGQGHPIAKRVLTGLRWATLLLLLIVALQPAIVTRFTKTQHSTLVVLVDDTLSMQWADRYLAESDRDALAGLLGIDTDKLSGEDRLSRIDLVRRVLGRSTSGLDKLAAEHPLSVYRFGVTGSKKEEYTQLVSTIDQVADAGGREPQADQSPKPPVGPQLAPALEQLTAGGFQTNLHQALREVLRKFEGQRLAGIVVISDGQNTAAAENETRAQATAKLLRERDVPVFAVAVGDPIPPRNVKLVALRGPSEVRKGSPLELTALVTNRHFGGAAAKIELWRTELGGKDWEQLGEAQDVALAGSPDDGAEAQQDVPLLTEAPEVGQYLYEARIVPLRGEMIANDNRAVASVRVTEEKVSVLVVSGDSGWEYQHLRNHLLGEKDKYKVSLWQQNVDPRFRQEGSAEMTLTALPSTREDLFRYDVIVLYDPKFVGNSFDGDFVAMLAEFVNSHHGGLCYIVGNKYSDANLLGGGPFSALANLLPVVLTKEEAGVAAHALPPSKPWPVGLTPEGVDHPLMQLSPHAGDSRQQWTNLPGIFRTHRVDRIKSLAAVLAVSGDSARRTVADDKPEPAIAVQYYGKGRVLYLGFDTTWLWRAVDDQRPYERFWSNAIDFLGAGRLEKKRIVITAGGESFDAGSEIRLRAEGYNRDLTTPLEAPGLTLQMTNQQSGDVRKIELTPSKPGLYEGTLLADRTGVFQMTAVAPEGSAEAWAPEDVSVRRIEIRTPQDEFRKPEANYETLRDLAGSDAHFLKLHQFDDLAKLVQPRQLKSTTEVPHMIWNTLLMLVLLGVLLLTEWTIRKAVNMM